MPFSRTLIKPFTREGIGLHTGTPSRVTVRPREGGGRVFRRSGVEIPALAEQVADTRRCTALEREGARVSTVEHLLAALALAGIDHAEIEVDGPELPALDGSALSWYDAIQTAGIRSLDEDAPAFRIAAAQWLSEGDSQFFLYPAEAPSLFAAVDFPGSVVERMMAGGDLGQEEVRDQIIRARTFALEREVNELRKGGLARGGSLDIAIVLTANGYLNDHVWPREPAWHKVLDLVGDLALIGVRVIGGIVAVRGGHAGHVALARRLRAEWLAAAKVAAR